MEIYNDEYRWSRLRGACRLSTQIKNRCWNSGEWMSEEDYKFAKRWKNVWLEEYYYALKIGRQSNTRIDDDRMLSMYAERELLWLSGNRVWEDVGNFVQKSGLNDKNLYRSI